MLTKEEVYAKLKELGIKFDVLEHKPVYTIDEMKEIEGMEIENVPKNLFLRNDNGKKHYLVALSEEKNADLKDLRDQIGSSRLSFASEDRLLKHMGLTKGSVTLLGLLNEESKDVIVAIDEDLKKKPRLGVHPCDNTATVWISYEDLTKILKLSGNNVVFVKI
ncbi:MAG: prolyl-tRNA synthetase associated domain-containing protein [Synergistaceae bacterium]